MEQPVERWLGARVVAASEGVAELRMSVGPQHLNGSGVLHGGVLFALADSTLAHAAIIPHGTGATLSAHIAFVAGCTEGAELVAVARTSARWGANALVDVTVTADGAVVAEFRGQARSPLR